MSKLNAISSVAVVSAIVLRVGSSLTGLTVTVTVVVAVPPLPSLTV